MLPGFLRYTHLTRHPATLYSPFMFRQPYTLDELRFAYAYNLYTRWHTHRWQPSPALPSLKAPTLHELAERHDIRVISAQADARELVAVTSLRPTDSASAAISKIKGSTSKWLREQTDSDAPKLLGEGYFACTTGNSAGDKVEAYLSKQGTHHGYVQRTIPPIFEQTFPCAESAEARLQPKHARAILRFHIVLATMGRKGVFGQESGAGIAAEWQTLGEAGKFFIEKVSFVPDHVHMSIRMHPSVKPAEVIVELLNRAEILMHQAFPEHLIQAGIDRLWQTSAYLGAYGDVTKGVVKRYIASWRGRGM